METASTIETHDTHGNEISCFNCHTATPKSLESTVLGSWYDNEGGSGGYDVLVLCQDCLCRAWTDGRIEPPHAFPHGSFWHDLRVDDFLDTRPSEDA